MSPERRPKLRDVIRDAEDFYTNNPWLKAEKPLRETVLELRGKYCDQKYSLAKEDREELAQVVDTLIALGNPETGLVNDELEDAGIAHLDLISLASQIVADSSPLFSRMRRTYRKVQRATRKPLEWRSFQEWNAGAIVVTAPANWLERRLAQNTRR